MRTTIYLDDHLAEQLKQAAAGKGMSLSAFLAESGRAAPGYASGDAGTVSVDYPWVRRQLSWGQP